MSGAYTAPAEVGVFQKRALIVGVVFMVLLAAGALMNRQQFFRSYLVAYLLDGNRDWFPRSTNAATSNRWRLGSRYSTRARSGSSNYPRRRVDVHSHHHRRPRSVSLDARGGDVNSRAQTEGEAVLEPAILHWPRRFVFCDLGVVRLPVDEMVVGAGSKCG